MSAVGTLWTVPGMRQAIVIRSVAALAGLQLDLPEYKHFEDNKKPEFTAKFPHGKIPALETADGFKLFEGAPIARYLSTLAPNSNLLGTNDQEAALVDQWVHFAESEISTPNDIMWQMLNGYLTPYNKPIHNTLAERQLRAINTLETVLATRTFLVTERITLADIVVASSFQRAVGLAIDASARAKLPNTIRHFETLANQPKLKEIFGETTYVEKAAQYVAPAKEKKPAAAAPAPAAPKEKKPKKVEDDEEDEPLVPEEPKAKNPLDSLPKSTFNLEDWKRAYSNKDTRGPGGALEWFYENFDKDGFSVWRVDFKYNEELTLTFMSSNQIGGFFNRLEASRKYLFGSVGVLGESNASIIAGALILRGQEATPVVNAAPDYESYEYKQLDLDNADDKKFFEGALAWDLEIDGKVWKDGKNFK
ncbi:hypothetical protein SERLA73DRAFT_143587 [Serpula lacrymans var. lacrymans S7.3]|uniref:Elongation factor 1-gamma n=2 Tax=Serpula lacrymans var. lacrymans TaxID=341189 RepID=F8QAD9_SERL3|nr:uncharacterized protein SERLADRAFT_400352 [Serpula lacrymans var. lacrymans S7.9]EGN94729.1 hypothetical protein SERLA73DRAFT_143587 [Serpula lacrymans var. lacrymans S7.3]EGO20209.1 hypothetical protein SERLADRAFT_400352 [Serpula lacrymans var. lacrymans S7.9]